MGSAIDVAGHGRADLEKDEPAMDETKDEFEVEEDADADAMIIARGAVGRFYNVTVIL